MPVANLRRIAGCLGPMLGCLAAAPAATAATVSVVEDNIVIDGVAVTTDHSEADPILTPDGRHVVFTHYGKSSEKMRECGFTDDDPRLISLWIADLDGKNPRKLLEGHGDPEPKLMLCDFAYKAFNSSGTLLYFQSPAWATSDAIHVVEMASGREHFVVDGNGLVVLSDCHDPQYRDDFIASRHQYFVFGGSYDWAYLFDPAGKVVGPLGDAEGLDLSRADEACGVSR